ncbi:MAG: endolytic transglycosylase MltG [Chloroflexi bacterium]|nr:endolytic transglycosylase MltG [Chloroflexota bacterium]
MKKSISMLILGLTMLILVSAGCCGVGGVSDAEVMDALLRVYLRFRQEEIARPASDDPTPVVFVVEPGETAGDIALRLKRSGLINDAELFRLLARSYKADSKLEAGRYELRANMSMEEIIEALQHGRLEEIAVTIPEGWRAEQIAEMLVEEVGIDGGKFLALVQNGVFDYEFLQDRPPEAGLEGFLFPDTYLFPVQPTALDIIERMLDNFDQRFTAEMRQAAVEREMTIRQVVTLASIVEREAVVAEERPIIAGVFLNRLEKGMNLEACPTVQYALGFQEDTGQWWKTPVTLEEFAQVNSPYNTYLHRGLPPGPICNPGFASIQAVLEPVESDYLYFLAKGDGSHAFAKTFEEHLQNRQRYQR